LFFSDLWNQQVRGRVRLQIIDSRDLGRKIYGWNNLQRFERYSMAIILQNFFDAKGAKVKGKGSPRPSLRDSDVVFQGMRGKKQKAARCAAPSV
jgi:hypothetical protein